MILVFNLIRFLAKKTLDFRPESRLLALRMNGQSARAYEETVRQLGTFHAKY